MTLLPGIIIALIAVGLFIAAARQPLEPASSSTPPTNSNWPLAFAIIVAVVIMSLISAYFKPAPAPPQAQQAVPRHPIPPPSPVFSLFIPANGNSERVTTPTGLSLSFSNDTTGGKPFNVHCVFPDGTDGILSTTSSNACHEGEVSYYYVHDLSGQPNTITYTLVHTCQTGPNQWTPC